MNTGNTIIDELKICYIAPQNLLEFLAALQSGDYTTVGDYWLAPTINHHFRFAFDISERNGRKVATCYYGRYGDSADSNLLFFRVENDVLYNQERFNYLMRIPHLLGLEFHNITSLDIACDAKINIAQLMKRMWRRADIATIINGKVIDDRKQILPDLKMCYSCSLERVSGLTVYVKQRRACSDKTKGITVQAYNKLMEIQTCSHKDYILDFYNNPKRLHRLEVHLNNEEIRDYCSSNNVEKFEDKIFEQEFRNKLFYDTLSTVIRFRRGREVLSWEEIIKRNGKV